ncbi:MAG: phosphohydrolase [Nitrospiraceae bacterium]|nr:phosphohydrolase [Nitrospiraceae bacterium]
MKCPGQDSRYWKSGAIFEVRCPKCGSQVEFFKDDTTRLCRKCGHRMVNPKMDFGCASYCPYAEQCLGNLPLELLAKRDDLLKSRVAIEMRRFWGQDFKQIRRINKVATYVEQIIKEEKGYPAVVLCAAYLYDIGIHKTEKEDFSIVRGILTKLGARSEIIDEVCEIIGHHHHPGDKESQNFKIFYDANLIVNIEERKKQKDFEKEKPWGIFEKMFLTDGGKRLAQEVICHDGTRWTSKK